MSGETCIGIWVDSAASPLDATLDSLYKQTPPGFAPVLLLDGEEAAAHSFSGIHRSATPTPLGAAACFNRLLAARDADYYIFLESGTLVGPGWLDHLLAALAADPGHGLAGPSTNRTWNEQQAFPAAGGSAAEVAATADECLRRFGRTWQTLEPLYSLADFCYAVKREVAAAIGGADEGYGRGPCWEMDYNIRAARAGFKGVWARAAYAYRRPISARRLADESRLLASNKQRYQDRFCGLRAEGGRRAYAAHCLGDACQHFAPPAAPLVPAADPAPQDATGPPLVSCVMPTRGRPRFVAQSIRYFKQQDYPHRELIVVYDDEADLPDILPDPQIRYARATAGHSIGAKRNQGNELARGAIIAQWDDDDWYAPDRLRRQAEPIIAGEADITGLNDTMFFDLDRWAFWHCTPALYSRMFVENVSGGTLVYSRRVWEELAGGYPDISLREDVGLMTAAMRRGARLVRIPGALLYIYLRHGVNTWKFAEGQFLDPGGWRRVDEPDCFAADRQFYHGVRGA